MATKNLIPRGSGEGGIGIENVTWGEAYFDTGNFNKGLYISGNPIDAVVSQTITQGGLGGKWDDGTNAGDIYYNGGNVGIGTTSPISLLHVENDSFGDLLTLRTVDGTNNPRLFIGTSSTGVYIKNSHSSAAGDIDFQDGLGGSKMLIKENGNVGIGTTNPDAKLDLASSSGDTVLLVRNAAQTLRFDQNSIRATTNNDLSMFTDGNAVQLYLKTDGNVGMGTANPGGKLHIFNNSAGNNELSAIVLSNYDYGIGETDQSVSIEGRVKNDTGGDNGVAKIIFGKDSDFSGINNRDGNIQFHIMRGNNGTAVFEERMRINSNGNVGIGTVTPDAALHVRAPDDSTNALALWVVNKAHDNSIISAYENGNVSIGDFNYKDNNGHVGIGTTDPGATLHAYSSINANTPTAKFFNGWGSSVATVHIVDDLTSTNHVGLFVGKDDLSSAVLMTKHTSVGIGTKNPAGVLEIRNDTNRNASNAHLRIVGGATSPTTGSHYIDNTGGAKYIISQDVVGGEIRMISSSNGVRLTSGGTVWVANSSDRRSKENISPLENVLDKVLQLSPSRYDYKEDYGNKDQIGFIAQEVEEVLPEFYLPGVTEEEMSTVKFSDNATTALLVKAIQEQQQIIEDLKSRIETLENK